MRPRTDGDRRVRFEMDSSPGGSGLPRAYTDVPGRYPDARYEPDAEITLGLTELEMLLRERQRTRSSSRRFRIDHTLDRDLEPDHDLGVGLDQDRPYGGVGGRRPTGGPRASDAPREPGRSRSPAPPQPGPRAASLPSWLQPTEKPGARSGKLAPGPAGDGARAQMSYADEHSDGARGPPSPPPLVVAHKSGGSKQNPTQQQGGSGSGGGGRKNPRAPNNVGHRS